MSAAQIRLPILTITVGLIFGAVLVFCPIAGQHGTVANIRMDVISKAQLP